MSPCHDMQPLVAARPLGALEPHEEAGVRAHLERCQECREFAVAVEDALTSAVPPDVPAPVGAWAAIEARLDAPSRPRTGWTPARVGVGGALLIGAALALAPRGAPPTPIAAPATGPAGSRAATPPAASPDLPPAASPTPASPGAAPPRTPPAPDEAPSPDTLAPAIPEGPLAQRGSGPRPGTPEAGPDPAPGPLPGRVVVPPPDGGPGLSVVPPGEGDELQRAEACLGRGDAVEAERLCTRALELDPTRVEAWVLRARIRAILGGLEGAHQDCLHAIELDPGCTEAWLVRAETRLHMGHAEEARADVARALALDPRRTEGWGLSGSIRVSQGDLAGALADFDRALELDPSDRRWARERGRVRLALGDPVGARADLERACELGDLTASIDLAELLLHGGGADERARELLESARARLEEGDSRRERIEGLLDDPRFRH